MAAKTYYFADGKKVYRVGRSTTSWDSHAIERSLVSEERTPADAVKFARVLNGDRKRDRK